jgi:HEAT repeat protein
VYDKSARQRALAVTALAEAWEKKRYDNALPNLTRALVADTSTAVRTQAAIALGGLEVRFVKPDGVGKALVEAMAKEKESRVRREIARSLGRHPAIARMAVKELAAALGDPEPATRAAVAAALGAAEGDAKSAAAELAPLMEDKDAGVRRAAIAALARIRPEGSRAIADAMAKMLTTETDADTREELVVALRLLDEKTPAVLSALKDLLADPSPALRRLAVRTLGRFGPGASSAADALLAAAGKRDETPEVRVDAVRSFGLVLGPEGLRERGGDLIKLFDDPQFMIRVAALEELAGLGNALKEDAKTKEAINRMRADPHVRVRTAAAEAIKRIEAEPKKQPEKKTTEDDAP